MYAHTIHIIYTYTLIHTQVHRFPAPCGDMVVARERTRQRGEEGWRWRSEFTAFNIGKMKYDRGRRASKEPPFCGINKFILLPRFVGGWCNFAYRCDRAYLSRSFPTYHSFKHSFRIDLYGRKYRTCLIFRTL